MKVERPRLTKFTVVSISCCTYAVVSNAVTVVIMLNSRQWWRYVSSKRNSRSFCDAVSTKLVQLQTSTTIHTYWHKQLEIVDRPAARALIPQLSPDNCLGYIPSTGPAKKGTLLEYVMNQKQIHPTKIILTRVGEFYETYGIDAVMLVQYAGLNAMGGKARAGFPIRNIQASLNNLTSAGLSIAVYEEIEDAESKAKIKSRALAQIVSPANTTYIYDTSLLPSDIEYHSNMPIVAIASTSQGYSYYEYRVDERVVSVSDRLTYESLISLISYSQPLEPIYTNVSLQLSLRTEVISGYSVDAFPQQVWNRICSEFGITACEEIPASPSHANSNTSTTFRIVRHNNLAPRPLYTSTALQIGLLLNPHIPDLLRYLLPRPHAKSTELFLRRWLLHPPPTEIANHMRSLCSLLSTSSLSVPIFIPLPLGKIVNLLNSRQCNVSAFSDIRFNIALMLSTLQSPTWNTILRHLLSLISYESGVVAVQETLVRESKEILTCIDNVIHPNAQTNDRPIGSVPIEFFDNNELQICDRVHAAASTEIAKLFSDLQMKRDALIAAVETDFGSDALYDSVNNIIYVKKIDREAIDYIPARDRFHQAIAKRYSTVAVVQATDNYLTAITALSSHIRIMLQQLCDELYVIYSHTVMARQQKWVLPTTSTSTLQLNDLMPYWMTREVATTNNVSIDGLIFLTAPNMSGKSTLMRSVLVAALLGNCGLFIPCSSASIPFYDGYYLRTTCYDVPAEGKSAFGMEMEDVQVMLRDCTSQSLIMLDEIGKGTSSRDGTCFAGALLEYFDSLHCHGVFATHLHEVTELALRVNNLQNMRMGLHIDDNGTPQWTYKIQSGVCTDSLAYVTASKFNIPSTVINRARELSQQFDAWRNATRATLSATRPIINSRALQEFISGALPELAAAVPAIIPHNYNPPAAIANSSCVYLLLIQSKSSSDSRYLYVGESESIAKRLARHRKSISHHSIVALVYSVKNKSQARSIETRLIRLLKHHGYDVHNKADEMHVAFGENSNESIQ